jgi:hypothetical protein
MCDTMMWLVPKEPIDSWGLVEEVATLNKQYRMDAVVRTQPTVRLGGYDQTVIPGYVVVHMSHAGDDCLCSIRGLGARGVLKLALLLEEIAPSWMWRGMDLPGNTVPTSGGTTNEALIGELRKAGADIDEDVLRAELALTRARIDERNVSDEHRRAQHKLGMARLAVSERGKALAALTGSTEYPAFKAPCEHEFTDNADDDTDEDNDDAEVEDGVVWVFCEHCGEAAKRCTKCGATWTECQMCDVLHYLDGTVSHKHECPM